MVGHKFVTYTHLIIKTAMNFNQYRYRETEGRLHCLWQDGKTMVSVSLVQADRTVNIYFPLWSIPCLTETQKWIKYKGRIYLRQRKCFHSSHFTLSDKYIQLKWNANPNWKANGFANRTWKHFSHSSGVRTSYCHALSLFPLLFPPQIRIPIRILRFIQFQLTELCVRLISARIWVERKCSWSE